MRSESAGASKVSSQEQPDSVLKLSGEAPWLIALGPTVLLSAIGLKSSRIFTGSAFLGMRSSAISTGPDFAKVVSSTLVSASLSGVVTLMRSGPRKDERFATGHECHAIFRTVLNFSRRRFLFNHCLGHFNFWGRDNFGFALHFGSEFGDSFLDFFDLPPLRRFLLFLRV